jgi:hypothetical protein
MLVGTIKKWWLVAAFVSGFGLAMWAEDLALNWRNNYIEFSAPHMHFLTGKPLDRLQHGAQVPFDFQVSLYSGTKSHLFSRLRERFLVSYDVWGEHFSVVKTQVPRLLVTHLDAAEAEAWCLKQMPVNPVGLRETEPLWATVEVRVPQEKSANPFGKDSISESGINLTGLIDLFSRPPTVAQPHWSEDTGPVTLEEVKRGNRRGS